jgi:predicted glycosyltransferase
MKYSYLYNYYSIQERTQVRYQLIAKLRHTVKPFMLMLKEKIFGTYVEIAEFIRI